MGFNWILLKIRLKWKVLLSWVKMSKDRWNKEWNGMTMKYTTGAHFEFNCTNQPIIEYWVFKTNQSLSTATFASKLDARIVCFSTNAIHFHSIRKAPALVTSRTHFFSPISNCILEFNLSFFFYKFNSLRKRIKDSI